MAEGKKGFILYADLIEVVKLLPDEMAGKLFKVILNYVNDLEVNIGDLLLQVTFEPIKRQLKHDLKKWEDTQHEKSQKGKLGNIKRWHPELYKKIKDKGLSLDDAIAMISNRHGSEPIAGIAVNGNSKSNSNSKTIHERKEVFKAQIREFAYTYPNQAKEFHKFFDYWTEKNENGRKMRWEKQKTWDLSRRLATWFDNVSDWKRQSQQQVKKQTAAEALKEKINKEHEF